MSVRSGYRSPRVNELAGSSSTSQHLLCEAADVEIAGVDNYELAVWIRDNLDFDQLILEFYTGEPTSGWIHVSCKTAGNRNECLTITPQAVSRGLKSWK